MTHSVISVVNASSVGQHVEANVCWHAEHGIPQPSQHPALSLVPTIDVGFGVELPLLLSDLAQVPSNLSPSQLRSLIFNHH